MLWLIILSGNILGGCSQLLFHSVRSPQGNILKDVRTSEGKVSWALCTANQGQGRTYCPPKKLPINPPLKICPFARRTRTLRLMSENNWCRKDGRIILGLQKWGYGHGTIRPTTKNLHNCSVGFVWKENTLYFLSSFSVTTASLISRWEERKRAWKSFTTIDSWSHVLSLSPPPISCSRQHSYIVSPPPPHKPLPQSNRELLVVTRSK